MSMLVDIVLDGVKKKIEKEIETQDEKHWNLSVSVQMGYNIGIKKALKIVEDCY